LLAGKGLGYRFFEGNISEINPFFRKVFGGYYGEEGEYAALLTVILHVLKCFNYISALAS
jgi:hypothetical protein